jgi:hypothetical protein
MINTMPNVAVYRAQFGLYTTFSYAALMSNLSAKNGHPFLVVIGIGSFNTTLLVNKDKTSTCHTEKRGQR